jgi:LPS-assembly lipoprotein
MIVRLRSFALLLLVAAMLSACGFNVRGSARQSGDQIVGDVFLFEAEPVSVAVQLRNALTAQQVRFVPKADQADTIIILDNEKLSRRVASVSASGRVSEYELLHAVDLRVLRSSEGFDLDQVDSAKLAAELIDVSEAQTVSVIRDYTYDETDVLAKDDEEQILREEMQQELLRHLVLRIFAGAI